MKSFSIIILGFLFLAGCQSRKVPPHNHFIKTIDLSVGLRNNNESVMLSEIANSIQYIFLETSEECLIDKIDKIMIDDSLVFIYNKKQFFIFNTSGAYNRSIGRLGKGPGEFLRIMDFTINRTEKKIFIYDSDQRKVLRYNYNGTFELEFKLDSYPTCITSMDDEYLILSWVSPDFIGNDYWGISTYSMDGKRISQSFNRESENANSSMPSTFLTRLNYYCDSLTYWEINLDTIYRVSKKGKLIPKYVIDYKGNDKEKDMNKVTDDIFRFSYFVESKKYLFFLRGVYNNNIQHLVYNKETGAIKKPYFESNDLNFSLVSGFMNDIDGGYPFLPSDALKDGRLYCNFYPLELKKLLQKNIYDDIEILNREHQHFLYEKINNSKMMDNPVIMLVTPN